MRNFSGTAAIELIASIKMENAVFLSCRHDPGYSSRASAGPSFKVSGSTRSTRGQMKGPLISANLILSLSNCKNPLGFVL